MQEEETCPRCLVAMVRQPERLDLSWAGDGPNAADVGFKGILVDVYQCPACREQSVYPAKLTLQSPGLGATSF